MADFVADGSCAEPPTKKRVAMRQISKDDGSDADDDETAGVSGGASFQRAPEEVLASRRILKVRRTTASVAPTPNPFAGIRLTPPSIVTTSSQSASETQSQVTKESDSSELKINHEALVNKEEGEEGSKSKSDVKVDSEEGKQEANPDKEDFGHGEKKEGSCEGFKEEGAKEGDDINTIVSEEAQQLKTDENKENESNKVDSEEQREVEEQDKDEVKGPTTSFAQLSSSRNAFSGAFGTGFSSSSFSFSIAPSSLGFSSGLSPSAFSFGTAPLSIGFSSGFSFGSTTTPSSGKSNGSDSTQPGVVSEAAGIIPTVSLQVVPVETGEEREKVAFSSDATLFEFSNGGWKERGKGEMRVNFSEEPGGGGVGARLVMRSKGNYRLLLNARIFPDMKLTSMDGRGVTFACINSAVDAAKDNGLTTYAARFKDGVAAAGFKEAVSAHKNKKTVLDSKTPESSPTASRDDNERYVSSPKLEKSIESRENESNVEGA